MILGLRRLVLSRGSLPLTSGVWTAPKKVPLTNTSSKYQLRSIRRNSKESDGIGQPKKATILPQSEYKNYEYVQPTLKRMLRPTGFTLLVFGSSFAGAAIWEYEKIRSRAVSFYRRSNEMMKDLFSRPTKFGSWRNTINEYWGRLSEGERLAIGIIGINTAIFLLWRIPAAQPFMLRYFCSNPAAKAVCWPMFLCNFSHYSFWHLGLNMYVLYNFSTGMINALGREQFLALYLSAGAFSSLASYLYKIVISAPGLSLGASGCLMAVIGFFCMEFPNSRLAIVFLPMLNFSADTALKAIIAVDVLGVLLRWKFFDHAAHLGGISFGIWYSLWGRKYIWDKREPFIQWWHSYRGNPTK